MKVTRTLLLLFVLTIRTVTADEPFSARVKSLDAPEMGSVTCYELTFAQETYLLVPPRGWTADITASAATLRFEDLKGGRNIELLFSAGSPSNALTHPEAHWLGALDDGSLLERFPVYTAAGDGIGCDLAGSLHGARLRSRVAVIPLKHGYVTFTLNSGSDQFAASQKLFGALLTTFQAMDARKSPP